MVYFVYFSTLTANGRISLPNEWKPVGFAFLVIALFSYAFAVVHVLTQDKRIALPFKEGEQVHVCPQDKACEAKMPGTIKWKVIRYNLLSSALLLLGSVLALKFIL